MPASHYMTAVKEDAFSARAPSEAWLSARADVAILGGVEIQNPSEDRLHAFQQKLAVSWLWKVLESLLHSLPCASVCRPSFPAWVCARGDSG